MRTGMKMELRWRAAVLVAWEEVRFLCSQFLIHVSVEKAQMKDEVSLSVYHQCHAPWSKVELALRDLAAPSPSKEETSST